MPLYGIPLNDILIDAGENLVPFRRNAFGKSTLQHPRCLSSGRNYCFLLIKLSSEYIAFIVSLIAFAHAANFSFCFCESFASV
jgi:hypothetical protein